MKINQSTVVKLTLTKLEDLDPISVYLEQFGKAGKVTFTCWGKSATAFFGAMGSDLIPFIASCNSDYIARKMVEGRITEVDYETIGRIIGEPDLDVSTVWLSADKLSEIYGCEWMLDLPTKETDEYLYAKLICSHIIEACIRSNGLQITSDSSDK